MKCKKIAAYALSLSLAMTSIGLHNERPVYAELKSLDWINCDDGCSIYYPGFGDDVCFAKYTGNDETVVIPEGVSVLWNIANEDSTVKKVVLPSTVREICDGAATGCTSLEEIVMSEGIEKIGAKAFMDCTSLKSVTIPDSVKEIKFSAFKNCTSLEEVKGGNGLENINTEVAYDVPNFYDGWGVFEGSKWVDESLVKNPVLAFGNTIYHVDTKNVPSYVEIPEGVTEIPALSFAHCNNLETIVIPEGVTTIHTRAFAWCENLKKVVLPESVTTIENQAFCGCDNIEEINITSNITEICRGGLTNTKWYKNYQASENKEDLSALGPDFWDIEISDDLVIPDVATYVYYSFVENNCGEDNTVRSITMPDSITEINGYAFAKSGKLKEITIPRGVEKIGANVFTLCPELENVYLPVDCEYAEESLSGYYGNYILPADIKSLTLTGAFGDDTADLSRFNFDECKQLEYLNLSGCKLTDEDIKYLSGCDNLKYLDLSDNEITDISALSGLTNLEELILNDNNISQIDISDLPNLSKIELDNNNINDISPLALLSHLKCLTAKNNNIEDFMQIYEFDNMEEFFLEGNPYFGNPEIIPQLLRYEDIECKATDITVTKVLGEYQQYALFTFEPTFPTDDHAAYLELFKENPWSFSGNYYNLGIGAVSSNQYIGQLSLSLLASEEPQTVKISIGDYSKEFSILIHEDDLSDKIAFNESVDEQRFETGSTDGVLLGDVDLDNKVSLIDAKLLLKHSLGISKLSEEAYKFADVNSDGSVNLTDAKYVLKRALGIISSYPYEGETVSSNDNYYGTVSFVGYETPWVYDSETERHKTMYDGTVVKEVLTRAGNTLVWGYYDDEVAKKIFDGLVIAQKQLGLYPDYWDDSMVSDAKTNAFQYAVSESASWGGRYYLYSAGLPNYSVDLSLIANAGGNQYEQFVLPVALGCFVFDRNSVGVTRENDTDKPYGIFWQTYFGTYYACSQ